MKKIYLLAVVLLSTMLMNAAPCKHYIVNTGNWEGTPYQVLYDTLTWATSYAEMTLEADSINGYSVFSYTIDPDTCKTAVNGFQFTDAAKAAWIPTKAVAIDAELDKYFYDGAWYEKKDIPAGPVTKKYYIIGDIEELGKWANFLLMDGDSIAIALAQGTTAMFQVYPGTDWTGGMGYSNINTECSSEGITEGSNNNIVITMKEAGDLKVKVVEGQLCVIGSFGEPQMESYTVVGDLAILGGVKAWDETDTINDMTYNTESKAYELEKVSMYLDTVAYSYRVVGNHSWSFMFPDANQTTEKVTEAGWYDIVFTFDAVANTLSSMIYPGEAPAALKPVTASSPKATKVFRNGQLIILKDNIPFSVLGTKL